MTLYELLEVSENASLEVIEKAYKVLAKRYHPDLQPQEKKKEAEEKMKKINDAYAILSDTYKREKYDMELKQKRDMQNQNKVIYRESAVNTNQYASNEEQKRQKMQEQIEKNMYEKYTEIYTDYLRKMGYRPKQKWTLKRVKEIFITIGIMLLIAVLLWFFPPTHKMLVNFYEGNFIVKGIVDFIIMQFS